MKTNTLNIAMIAFLVLFAGGAFLMSYLQESLQGTTLTLGVDIYPRWVGSQIALHGKSPYSLETRHAIWNAIYGSPNTPTGNPFGFYYPPSVVTLLAPFIILGISVKQAAMLGCAALWALWVTFAFLWIIKAGEKSTIIMALLLLSALFFRPAFSNYILGQSALFCTIATWAAWTCLRRRWNVTAGILLSLALIKPSLSLLPVVLLLVFNHRTKNLIIAFLAANFFLFIPPTILLGWWVPDFLADLAHYSFENQTAWNVSHMLTIPGILNLILSGSLLTLGWLRKDVLLILASAFALNALFVPHTADYDLIIFMLLILWIYEQKEFIPTGRTLLTLTLLWLPWISLLSFNWIQPGHVEDWYPFMWNLYPSLLLLVTLMIGFQQIKQPQLNTIG